MSAITCNGAPVLRGEVTRPRVGNWTATIDVVADALPARSVTLRSFDERWSLVGYAMRAETFADLPRLFLVGGSGGLSKAVEPRAYVKVSARAVAEDILTETGERLSADSKIEGQLERWSYNRGRCDSALSELVDFLGLTWRVKPSGEVWIGKDTYPAASDREASLVDSNAGGGSMVFESPAPFFEPGVTVDGKKIETVVHVFGPKIVSSLFFDGADRVRGALRTIVEKAIPFDRFAAYFCRVVSQNSDGTLELKPDSPKLSGFSKVPIKLGVPGITVKVNPGSRVALEWDGADPSKPIATVWDSDSLDSIEIKAKTKVSVDAPLIVAQDGRPLARLGDRVVGVSTPPGTPFVGMIATANMNHKG